MIFRLVYFNFSCTNEKCYNGLDIMHSSASTVNDTQSWVIVTSLTVIRSFLIRFENMLPSRWYHELPRFQITHIFTKSEMKKLESLQFISSEVAKQFNCRIRILYIHHKSSIHIILTTPKVHKYLETALSYHFHSIHLQLCLSLEVFTDYLIFGSKQISCLFCSAS